MQPFNLLVLNNCKWGISAFGTFLSSHCTKNPSLMKHCTTRCPRLEIFLLPHKVMNAQTWSNLCKIVCDSDSVIYVLQHFPHLTWIFLPLTESSTLFNVATQNVLISETGICIPIFMLCYGFKNAWLEICLTNHTELLFWLYCRR